MNVVFSLLLKAEFDLAHAKAGTSRMPIPKSLSDKLRKGHVVPFVGAGVSMNVRNRLSGKPIFPSWRQLLIDAADRLEHETKSAEAETGICFG